MRITVVCLGNICRSPIGEVVLRDRLRTAGLSQSIQVDSAGTGDWHLGHDADPRSVAVLTSSGYTIDHTARQIQDHWLNEIDLVLAMDTVNYADLRAMITRAGSGTRLHMMRAFDPELAHVNEPDATLDVPDPYYGDPGGFADVLAMVERASDGLVAHLAANQGPQ